jgi:glutathione S-transferase
MRLYDTQRSGNAWKVRLMAGFLGVKLERRSLSIDRGDLRTDAFGELNSLRQVPVLELPDGRTLSESMAILFYLADGTPWWPTNRFVQAEVIRWLSFEQSRHMHALAQLRLHIALHPDWPLSQGRLAQWRQEANEALDRLAEQLAACDQHGWVASTPHPSIADVALYPYTRLAAMGGIDPRRLPAIAGWLDRIEALPGYVPLFPGRPDLTECRQEI